MRTRLVLVLIIGLALWGVWALGTTVATPDDEATPDPAEALSPPGQANGPDLQARHHEEATTGNEAPLNPSGQPADGTKHASTGDVVEIPERDARGRGFHFPEGARPRVFGARGSHAVVYVETHGLDDLKALEVRALHSGTDDACKIVRLPGALLILVPMAGLQVGESLELGAVESGRAFAALRVPIRAGADGSVSLAKQRAFTGPQKNTGFGRLLLEHAGHTNRAAWKEQATQTLSAMAALFEERARALERVGQRRAAEALRKEIATLITARERYINAVSK